MFGLAFLFHLLVAGHVASVDADCKRGSEGRGGGVKGGMGEGRDKGGLLTE